MNGGTEDVEAQPTHQPKNQQNDRDIPKHKNLWPAGAVLTARETYRISRPRQFPLEKRRFRQPYRCLETPVQPFPRAALPETEAHLHLDHHPGLRPRGDVRRDRPHPGYFRHDRLRSRAAAKGDRLRRPHPRHDRRHHDQLARSHGENPQHPGRGRDRALHSGAGDRGIPESSPRADDPRDRSGRRRKGHPAAQIHQAGQARSRRAIRPCSAWSWRRSSA